MGRGIHTAYKFRHWTTDPETGLEVLDWASGLNDEPVRDLQIVKGSDLERQIIEAQEFALNALADEGEEDMLDVYFDTQAVRASLFGRLYNDTPTEADTLATLTGEVTGTGYGAVTFTRGTDWGAPVAATGTTSTTKTFTATGTWTSATQLILATIGSGTAGLHIAFTALSATRTLVNGDTLDVSQTVTLE